MNFVITQIKIKIMNHTFKYGFAAMTWLMLSFFAFAGPIDPPLEEDPEPVSIHNGMHYLFLTAVFIGIFFLIRREIKLTKE